MAGLVLAILRLKKNKPAAALGITGILFMHATASMTNVNLGHNYYATMLSVAVSLTLLLSTCAQVSSSLPLSTTDTLGQSASETANDATQ
jgi:hypothetical protein